MHILLILDYFSPHIGGVETLFTNLTKHHIAQGNTVTVITSKHSASLADYETIDGVTINRVGQTRCNRLQLLIKANQIISNHTIDLIHTSTYSAALPARCISKRFNIPTILHVHEVYGELWHQFLSIKAYCNKRFEHLIVGLLPRDEYHCVSRYTLNSVRTHFNLPDHKLHLKTNPIDHEFWQSYCIEEEQTQRTSKIQQLQLTSKLDNLVIGLYYGRTGKEKGLDLLINAIPHVIINYPNFHQVIIAPNNQSPPNQRSKLQTSHNLQGLIKDLGIEDHVTWLAPVNSKQDIKDWIAASDVVILPSRTEGFGYAMHEVAMMNTKLITTQVGGQIETLSEYNTIYWMEQVTSEEIVNGVSALFSSKNV